MSETPRGNGLRQGFGSQELRGIYGFLPFGTGCRPTGCFFRNPAATAFAKASVSQELQGMIKFNGILPGDYALLILPALMALAETQILLT